MVYCQWSILSTVAIILYVTMSLYTYMNITTYDDRLNVMPLYVSGYLCIIKLVNPV